MIAAKYIGPLEEMVRIYQIYKSMGKVEKLSERGLCRLVRTLLKEYERTIDRVVEKLYVRVGVVSSMGSWEDTNGGGPAGI